MLLAVVALIVPHVPVNYIPTLSTASLAVPILISIHVLFTLFWFVRRKKRMLPSLLILVVWYLTLGPFYLFSGPQKSVKGNGVSIMTFNTRGFNEYGQLDKENVDSLIIDFVTKQDPDIVCFQECYHVMKINDALGHFPYKYVDYEYGKRFDKVIQAIYSKFPILEIDSVPFPRSANTTIYADLLIDSDTVRMYNVHLQSFRIIPELDVLSNQKSSKLLSQSKKVMQKQYQQAGLIQESMQKSPYKNILVGDFNNTHYSNIYRTIIGDMKDSFMEKGSGFGRSYNFLGFPMRIDYILADPSFEVLTHQNFDVKLSDHYPVMATLKLK